MTSAHRFAIVLLALILLPASGATAQIYVDKDATGANDGTSWADAYTDLQTAINTAGGSSELWIAEGVYTPDSQGDSFTITGAKDGIKLYGGFEGTESSRDQRAPEQHRTILSGDVNGDDTTTDAGVTETTDGINGDENSNTVLYLDGTTTGGPITEQTVIDGFTITAGDADEYGGDLLDKDGGGLYCDGRGDGSACSPTLSTLVFAGNFGGVTGALVNNAKNGRASPRIIQTTFVGNRGRGQGGAIRNYAREGGVASPHITKSTFKKNEASFAGGAIANLVTGGGEASPTIAHSTFRENVAPGAYGGGGGAIYIGGNKGVSSPTITHTIFANNKTTEPGSSGGAIWIVGFAGTAEPTITHSVFVGNSANPGGSISIGGALYINGLQSDVARSIVGATVVSSAFINNGANHVAYSDATDGPTPALVNCTFTGAPSEAFRVIDNSAGRSMRVANAIIWGNAGDVVGGRPDDPDAAVEVSTSLVEEESLVGNGTGNVRRAPQFVASSTPAGPDGSWGTFDDGLRPSFQSPALDRGDNAVLPEVSGPPTDLRGAPRRQDFDRDGDSTVDLGAYEVRERPVSVTGGGLGGLDRQFDAQPGATNQPIGVLRLTPAVDRTRLTGLTVTPDASDASGVQRVALWLSDDPTFEAGPEGDDLVDEQSLDPTRGIPTSLPFEVDRLLSAGPHYLFVTVDLTADAKGTVTGFLASESNISFLGSFIDGVNGSSGRNSFSQLPLSTYESTLPVEMASFEGTTTEDGVQLRWETASEQNNAGFRIQRKGAGGSGGVGEWTEVGFVEGAGTTSEGRSYRFTDDDLPYEADTLVYRLRQVDTDGSTSFTDPVTVARSGPEQVELLGTAPNPVRQRATVRYAVPEGTDSEVTLQLFDVLGRQVRSVQTEDEPGRHEQTLDVGGLSSGVYVLRLRAGDTAKTRKLTVIR